MKKLKNKALGRVFEHSCNEIDLASLKVKGWKDREADNVMSQEMFLVFPLGRIVFFVLSLTQRAMRSSWLSPRVWTARKSTSSSLKWIALSSPSLTI